MDRTRFKFEDKPLRDQIFELLRNSRTSVEDDLTALLQCASHIRNRMLIEQTAKECGLKLSGLHANENLELYVNLKQGRVDMGYLSKGWDDPGFRVGNIVKVPLEKMPILKANVYSLLKYCATRGVSLTIAEEEDHVALHMDTVIYMDGFNKKVFQQVLQYLDICVEKVQELME